MMLYGRSKAHAHALEKGGKDDAPIQLRQFFSLTVLSANGLTAQQSTAREQLHPQSYMRTQAWEKCI